MINDKCFTIGWLESFKKQKAYQKIDKIILEKIIYAIHLLEQLKIHGLDFVFKGGTSLILLLEEANRFSIDIICPAERNDLEEIFNNVMTASKFSSYELDEHRSYKPGVPKAHYGLTLTQNSY